MGRLSNTRVQECARLSISVGRRGLQRSIFTNCPWRFRSGQAILEYMVIAGAVVLAIMLFRSSMNNAVQAVYNQAANHATGAAVQLRGMSW